VLLDSERKVVMMRRSVFLTSLLVVSLAVFGPPTASAHEGTEIAVEGQVRADGSIELEGEEFAPNDIVRIELRKEGVEPIPLGNVHADATGAFNETLHVPASVRSSIYLPVLCLVSIVSHHNQNLPPFHLGRCS